MPIYFKNECRRCGKVFEWVHYEMVKSSVRSGRFQVERLPSKLGLALFVKLQGIKQNILFLALIVAMGIVLSTVQTMISRCTRTIE